MQHPNMSAAWPQAGSQFRHKAEPAGHAKGDAWVPGKNVTMTLQVTPLSGVDTSSVLSPLMHLPGASSPAAALVSFRHIK